MSEKILFDFENNKIIEKDSFDYEKEIQKIVEKNMFQLFNVNILKTELTFNDFYGKGRTDTIAIDNDGNIVIFEYKLKSGTDIIVQTLNYKELVQKNYHILVNLVLKEYPKLFKKFTSKNNITVKIVCIANRYDNKYIKAVKSDVNIKEYVTLVTYTKYRETSLISFDIVAGKKLLNNSEKNIINKKTNNKNEVSYAIETKRLNNYNKFYPEINGDRKLILEKMLNYISSFVPNYVENHWIHWTNICNKNKRIIISYEIRQKTISVWVNIKYDTNKMKDIKKIENLSGKGHWGSGEVKIILKTLDDFEIIKPFIKESIDND
ncbi:hypothetical protein ACW95P_04375 [Candidatus Mycoplasma pogonae]